MYDVLVLGAGPGGYVAAVKAAKRGAKVAVVDRGLPGGVCLHTGCIPTKTLLSTAQLYRLVQEAGKYGIDGVDPKALRPNWPAMLKRKDKVVGRLTKGIESLFKMHKIDFFQGEAVVESPRQVRVNDQTLEAKSLILATGSHETLPDVPGVKEEAEAGRLLDSAAALALKDLPASMIVVGGHVVAVEFAVLFNAMGVDVTLLNPAKQLLQGIDRELVDLMEKQMKKDRIRVLSGVELTKFSKEGISVNGEKGEEAFTADTVLMATGKAANTKGIEALGLALDARGFVETDDQMRTNVKDVYAIGDMNGKYPLAHVASHEGMVAATNATGGDDTMSYRTVPHGMYTIPEIASVGLTEEEAREQYPDLVVSRYPLSANGKALAEGQSTGFGKVLSEPKYGEVVGVHIAAPNATDMIVEGVVAMQLEATLEDLARAVHAHPTPSEILMEAALGSL